MSSTSGHAFARARTDEQRAERRESILTTASELLVEYRVTDLSLNELARRVGLAKSNVLRYFESREAILLELFDREYRAWLDALESELTRQGSVSPASGTDQAAETVASAIAATVAVRPVFCDLCASAAGVLERNVSAEVAAEYKKSAVAGAYRLADIVRPFLGDLTMAQGTVLVGTVNLVVGGVWSNSQPSPGMALAYEQHAELRAMRLDLETAVREILATLMVGILHRR
jgi:AcrR family transcriptional regulator